MGKHHYRHPHLLYNETGWYFITICTAERQHFFGEIREGVMHLSPAGEIAAACILLIQELHLHVRVEEWVVMPNHVHLLLKLAGEIDAVTAMQAQFIPRREWADPLVPGSVSSLINHFKGAVTKKTQELEIPFKWHPRFHDIVARTEEAVSHIRMYIRNNPATWDGDEFR